MMKSQGSCACSTAIVMLFGLAFGLPVRVVLGATGSPDWQRNAFPLPESIWSVEAVDANADGKLDLIAIGETKVFALMAPDWKEYVLVDTKEPKMLYCVALDADGDGDLDIALARYQVP